MTGWAYGAAASAAMLLVASGLLKFLPLRLPHASLLVDDRSGLAMMALKRPAAQKLTALLELAVATGVLIGWRSAAAGAAALSAGFLVFAMRAVVAKDGSSCGCMGALSRAQSGKSVLRAAVLMIGFANQAWQPQRQSLSGSLTAAVLVGAVLAWSSPELAELHRLRWRLVRPMTFSGDCATTQVAYPLMLKDLRASSIWSDVRTRISGTEPLETWREGCWSMMEFEAKNQDHYIVVAMRHDPRDARVVLACVAADSGETVERVEATYDVTSVWEPELASV